MNHNPLVSVITPCYNCGNHLLQTVRSVAASTYSDIEHIVIDDGSTDPETLSVLDKLEGTPNLKILRTPNQGVCRARNQAILASLGEYILPVDGDDLISEKFIALAVEKLAKNPHLKAVATNYRLFGKINKSIALEPFSIEKLLAHNLFTISTMFPRHAFEQAGGFKENMKLGFEDWDFWLSLLKSPEDVAYLEGEHFLYRIKSKKTSRNTGSADAMAQALRKQLWENHRELYAEHFLDPTQCFEYLSVVHSKEYRLGRRLLGPLRKLLGR